MESATDTHPYKRRRITTVIEETIATDIEADNSNVEMPALTTHESQQHFHQNPPSTILPAVSNIEPSQTNQDRISNVRLDQLEKETQEVGDISTDNTSLLTSVQQLNSILGRLQSQDPGRTPDHTVKAIAPNDEGKTFSTSDSLFKISPQV